MIPKIRTFAAARLSALAAVAAFFAKSSVAMPNVLPRLIERDGHHALLVDGEPFFILGGQCNNSSAWPAMLPKVWSSIETMHANTLEAPLYWQQIEPAEGTFDFSVMETIIKQAREHHVHLVFLWFASWKNSNTDYTPDWVKLDPKKYFHVVDRTGKTVLSPSPYAKATMEADAKAFTAVMAHLKDFDPQHTVIMVQVENEPGTYGSPRDFSEAAEKLFHGSVPPELMKPGVLQALNKSADVKGTWSQVFGSDADEFFHAWSVAKYINYVAAAGKAINPLPMYVNVALEGEPGGAMHEVIPIYKVAAPSIDILGPDIYQPPEKGLKTIEQYDRPDNPLYVPETFGSVDYLYDVIRRGGIGFSPFGIDRSPAILSSGTKPWLSPVATQYEMLRLADREFGKWVFEGRIHTIAVSEQEPKQELSIGGWQVTVSFGAGRRFDGKPAAPAPALGANQESANPPGFGPPLKPTGRAIVAQWGENEFVVMGTQCRLAFEATGANKGKPWQFLKVEEGYYENGAFKLLRLRNGDEVGWATVSMDEPALLRVTMTAW